MEESSYSLSKHGPLIRVELLCHQVALGNTTQVCAYRLGDTLIDTGGPKTIASFLVSQKSDLPKRIILTHQHEDHTGGVAAFCREFGDIPVYCPEQHVEIISTTNKVPAYRVAHWGDPEPYDKLIPYSEGDIFTEGNWQIIPIETPGHTVGHMSFHITDGKEHFILPGDLYLGPTCYMAFGESSVPDFISSLQKLIDLTGNYIGLPSHGEVLPDGRTSFQALQDWYKQETEISLRTAQEIGSSDYVEVFKARFGKLKPLEKFSEGEVSRLALLRGIFEPVTSLPATSIRMPL